MTVDRLPLRPDELSTVDFASRSSKNEGLQDLVHAIHGRTRKQFREVVGRERLGCCREMLADGLDLVGE